MHGGEALLDELALVARAVPDQVEEQAHARLELVEQQLLEPRERDLGRGADRGDLGEI